MIGELIRSVEWGFVLIVVGVVFLFSAAVGAVGFWIEKSADRREPPRD